MNAETTERLLIDRSLGMLSEDVETLLEAHLAVDAEAASLAAKFDQTATLARRALAGEAVVKLPPFPAERVRSEGRSLRRWIWTRNISAVAAALVLGVGLGAAMFGGPASVVGNGGGATGNFTVRKMGSPPVSTRWAGMWSTRRLIERAAREPEKSASRLIWDSPVRKPRLGDT